MHARHDNSYYDDICLENKLLIIVVKIVTPLFIHAGVDGRTTVNESSPSPHSEVPVFKSQPRLTSGLS